jgi:uncharacterized protein (TIGR03435 family)
MRTFTWVGSTAIFLATAMGQTPEAGPKFEIADVHVSAKTPNPFARTGPVRGGRYEIKTATMVDLVRIAYGVTPDMVVGGPNWLEMDRFDVVGKVPPEATADAQKLMLQALLAERFQLVIHNDTRPVPAYALTVGKKPQMKEADGSGETGCKPKQGGGPSTEGAGRLMTRDASGRETTIVMGPGATIEFSCRNMTMAAFAAGLRGMLGSTIGAGAVLDQTGLKGSWNFDVRWSLPFIGPAAAASDRVTMAEALEKQLGLKLEQKPVPTPVIVVDRVNEKPSENPPGVAEGLPAIPQPTEFEVADVKLSGPDTRMRFQVQPGGRFTAQGTPMRFLISEAFNVNGNDQIAGVPTWADSEHFDITAKAPAGTAAVDMTSMGPLLRSLLADRFKMTYHTEQRPVSAYSLVAAKPKMKKADPASRTSCRYDNAPVNAAPGSRAWICQNITMAQFAERLQNVGPGLNWPVLDATGIEGGWDLTLTYSQFAMLAGPGRGGDVGQGGLNAPVASDPGGGYTIFEAMEKQLGLKLESQKRPMPVIVIDHIEQKPTEN